MTSAHKDTSISTFRREKEKAERERAAAAAAAERLKTVVRRLPPNLPEEVFWQSVQQWVTDETVSWKVFYPGKYKKKLNKENIPSRAYIAFKNEDILSQFSREYDGHVFRDKQGNESQAVVEFAPYQKVPPEKKKIDARNATIEKDEDYISFMALLNEQANAEPVSIETLIASMQQVPMPKTTPLLEALKAEKSAIKDKEAILRNHAHYKDPSVLTSTNAVRNVTVAAASASTKDDGASPGKKKGGPAAAHREALQAGGKKSKKAQAAALKQQQQLQQQQAAASGSAKKDTTTAPSKRPKSPKASRHQAPAAKATAAPQAQAKTPEILTSVSSPPDGDTVNPSAMNGVAAQVSSAAAARRGRPIVGLASRQLQAALSQVGAAAVERKRRERETEAAMESTAAAGVGEADKPAGKGKESEAVVEPAVPINVKREEREKPKPGPPPSPRRDRKRKEKGSGHPEGLVKVPSIMQRPEGVPPPALQHDTPGQVLPSPAQIITSTSTANDAPTAGGHGGPVNGHPHPRGGGRRGRGRGRGGLVHRGG
ncbi:hypothetical protein AX17_007014 [Amanita inopinata Kibby_2008]|nr:hypothetical protein AX17_007014 [Amanita inopinata Kibby_2008]